MRKKVKKLKQIPSIISNTKVPIRVLYKKVGQIPEVKIISDVYKLKKAIVQRNLDATKYFSAFQ